MAFSTKHAAEIGLHIFRLQRICTNLLLVGTQSAPTAEVAALQEMIPLLQQCGVTGLTQRVVDLVQAMQTKSSCTMPMCLLVQTLSTVERSISIQAAIASLQTITGQPPHARASTPFPPIKFYESDLDLTRTQPLTDLLEAWIRVGLIAGSAGLIASCTNQLTALINVPGYQGITGTLVVISELAQQAETQVASVAPRRVLGFLLRLFAIVVGTPLARQGKPALVRSLAYTGANLADMKLKPFKTLTQVDTVGLGCAVEINQTRGLADCIMYVLPTANKPGYMVHKRQVYVATKSNITATPITQTLNTALFNNRFIPSRALSQTVLRYQQLDVASTNNPTVFSLVNHVDRSPETGIWRVAEEDTTFSAWRTIYTPEFAAATVVGALDQFANHLIAPLDTAVTLESPLILNDFTVKYLGVNESEIVQFQVTAQGGEFILELPSAYDISEITETINTIKTLTTSNPKPRNMYLTGVAYVENGRILIRFASLYDKSKNRLTCLLPPTHRIVTNSMRSHKRVTTA